MTQTRHRPMIELGLAAQDLLRERRPQRCKKTERCKKAGRCPGATRVVQIGWSQLLMCLSDVAT